VPEKDVRLNVRGDEKIHLNVEQLWQSNILLLHSATYLWR